jgi:hypothetical protein
MKPSELPGHSSSLSSHNIIHLPTERARSRQKPESEARSRIQLTDCINEAPLNLPSAVVMLTATTLVEFVSLNSFCRKKNS